MQSLPVINQIYCGRVTEVQRHGLLVKLNGFKKEFKGLLHNSDSTIIINLIVGYLVNVKIVSVSSDGFISITTKNIDQPVNQNKNNTMHKNAKSAFDAQKRKFRTASPGRLEEEQYLDSSPDVIVQIINEEPRFLKNIQSKVPSTIPNTVPVVKNVLNFMAQTGLQKSKSNQSSAATFSFQQASFNYEWTKALNSRFGDMHLDSSNLATKTIGYEQFTKMSIDKQRKALPIYQYREKIIQSVTENQFLIVIGETGSGWLF